MANWKDSGKVTNICCIGAGYVVSSPRLLPCIILPRLSF
jgi:hypothetical protein